MQRTITVHWTLFTGYCSLDTDQVILPPPFAQDEETAVDRLLEAGRLDHIAHSLVIEVDAPALNRAAGIGL